MAFQNVKLWICLGGESNQTQTKIFEEPLFFLKKSEYNLFFSSHVCFFFINAKNKAIKGPYTKYTYSATILGGQEP